MLNRLMFVYFIQKKGFLDGDPDYLRNRLRSVQQRQGKDKFQPSTATSCCASSTRASASSQHERKLDRTWTSCSARCPTSTAACSTSTNWSSDNPDIEIPDEAFEQLFDFFDDYHWHLDERPLRADNEINPDVLGYIFEKYINQKQMGAYYTKEDITEYIAKNTIIPFLFDAAEKKCADRLQARRLRLAAAARRSRPLHLRRPCARASTCRCPPEIAAGRRRRRQARRLEPPGRRATTPCRPRPGASTSPAASAATKLRDKLDGRRSPRRSTT